MKILLLILTMFITGNVKALDKITSIDEPWTQEATVGEVDGSLSAYDIDVYWDSFVFDYVYDEETDSYKWVTNNNGLSETSLSISNNNHLNKPITITTAWQSTEEYNFVNAIFYETGYICEEAQYNEEEFNSGILLTGDRCNADSELLYDDPEFSYDSEKYYKTTMAKKKVKTGHPVGYYVPEFANRYDYSLHISLENDSTKEAKTPKTGDTIGTFTITFEDAEPNDQ